MKQKNFQRWLSALKRGMVILTLLAAYVQTFGMVTVKSKSADPWVLDKTVDNVEFYYQLTECDGRKVVFLKFVNKNNYNVKISWKESFETQTQKQVDGFRGRKQLVISSGETSQTGCSDRRFRECLVLPEDADPTAPVQIARFSYKDISVSNDK